MKKAFITVVITSVIVSSVFGGVMGFWAATYTGENADVVNWFKQHLLGGSGSVDQSDLNSGKKIITVDQESAIINAAQKVSPAVVSIIITKDLPKIQNYNPFGSDFYQQFFGQDFNNVFGVPQSQQQPGTGGTEKQEIGGGSGFIITSDGYIVTNGHVVSDNQAEYTVLMNDERKFSAKVLDIDTINDVAVLKIEAKNLPTVELGDSSNLKVGQTVIAIGNALGEFRNTVSTGVISGLARSITAGGAATGSEQLFGVIQTDASINPGNSGGPLLNIAGQVIGINTAIVQNAQNIGFAIPINSVMSSIDSIKKFGKIIRPYLGVRYTLINQTLADANKLPVNYGALIVRGQNAGEVAIVPGSPADKAGLVENDIILKVNNVKVDENNPLANILSKSKVGDEITLRIMHDGKEKQVKVRLEQAK